MTQAVITVVKSCKPANVARMRMMQAIKSRAVTHAMTVDTSLDVSDCWRLSAIVSNAGSHPLCPHCGGRECIAVGRLCISIKTQ